jgi:hypothetical protein
MAKPSYPATLNTSDALASGLQGFWLMNEDGTSTVAHDSTATANNGTIAADVSWTTGDGSDPVLSFPASATANLNVIDLGSSLIYRPAALTLAVRFYADSGLTGTWQTLFGRGSVYAGWTYTLVYNGDTLRWYTTTGDWAGGTVSRDIWHTVIATWDGATGRIYVDGTTLSPFAQGGSLSGAFRLAIGRGSDGSAASFSNPDGFGGKISYAGIWSREFSATDRTDFFATPFRMFSGSGPVATPNFVGGLGVPGQVPVNYAA